MGVKFKKEGDWADGAKFDTTFDATIPNNDPSIPIPAGQTLDDFLGNPGGPPIGDNPMGGSNPMGGTNPFFANLPQGMDSGAAAFDMYAQQDMENQMGGFSPVVQNSVANVFDNRDNNNTRYSPVGGEDTEGMFTFEDFANQPTADQIYDDPNLTYQERVDLITDTYGDAGREVILGRENENQATVGSMSDSYGGFPIDVLAQILRTMGDSGNQDAIDILNRSQLPDPNNQGDANQNQTNGGNQTNNENVGDDQQNTNGNIIIGGDGNPDGQNPGDDQNPEPDENGVCPIGYMNVNGICISTAQTTTVDDDNDGSTDIGVVCPTGTLRAGETVTSLSWCDIPKKNAENNDDDDSCQIVGGVQYVRNAEGECVPPSTNIIIDDDPDDPDDPDNPDPPVPPITGGNMGFGDFQSTLESYNEADQELRRRSMNLLGSQAPTQSLMQRYNQGMTPFAGQRFTGLNADQIAANQMLRNNVNAIPGQNILDQATAAAGSLAPIRANTIGGDLINQQAIQSGGRQRIQDIVAQQFAGTNLAPYTNPYDQQVVDAALNDIERARQIQLQDNASRATLAGAYGGDRAALIDAETNRAALDTAARTAASLRQQGFNDAADRVEADANRAMAAAQSNQSADAQTVRDALSIASDNLQANMAQQRAADTDTQLNQIRQSQALLDAFGQGSDVYRQYLADFVGLGDRLDQRDQRELDFDYDQFLLGQDFDQQQITNLLNLIQRSPQNTKRTDTVDAGVQGDLAALTQIADLAGVLGSNIGAAAKDPEQYLRDLLGL